MSTDELQRWQNAAQFAGLRTEDMTSALTGIGSAFEASTKGNNQLKADMARFGIVATRTAGGTIDVADGLRQVEQAARGITNMQARREFLDMFGAGALLPMIGRLDELAKKAREAGVSIANTAGGAAFEQEMVRMRIATERFVYQIGEALLPTTTKVVTAITRLTDKFGGLTATRIAEYAERLATAIADIDWDGAAQRASGYIDKLDNVATVTGRVLDLIPGTKREPTPQWNTKYGPGFGDLTWNQKAALAMGGRIDQASQLKLWEKREGLPAGAMDALYAAESDRGRNAGKSSAGALGPFQFMPDTGREYGLNSIEDNILAGEVSSTAAWHNAFDIRHSVLKTAAELRAFYDNWAGSAPPERIWKAALLNHNFPAAASRWVQGTFSAWQYVAYDANGVKRTYGVDDPAYWVITASGGRLGTCRQWCEQYIERNSIFVTSWA
jgi:hypothetical protein